MRLLAFLKVIIIISLKIITDLFMFVILYNLVQFHILEYYTKYKLIGLKCRRPFKLSHLRFSIPADIKNKISIICVYITPTSVRSNIDSEALTQI